jgi:hypothetical protein
VTKTLREQLHEIARHGGVPIERVVEEHAERAAIREYLGGMPRAEADRAALRDACEVFGLPDLQEDP